MHWQEVRSPVACHLQAGDLGGQSPGNQKAYGGIHVCEGCRGEGVYFTQAVRKRQGVDLLSL